MAAASSSNLATTSSNGNNTVSSSNSSTRNESSVKLASKLTPHSIIVSKRQKGNPILKFIRNVPWEFGDIVPDYELGRCNCACFLSLRYHNRYPEYVHTRLKELGKSYDLRILLALNDTKQQDVSHELNQLAKICLLADCTLILAFSAEEAARYLEVYKAYETKQPIDIMPKVNKDYLSQATDCLTSIKGVNKSDVSTLLNHFKTISGVVQAEVDQLSLCPGIGPLKAQRLHKTFSQPFNRDRSLKHSSATTVKSLHAPDKQAPASDKEAPAPNKQQPAPNKQPAPDKQQPGTDKGIAPINISSNIADTAELLTNDIGAKTLENQSDSSGNKPNQLNTEESILNDQLERVLHEVIDPTPHKKAKTESEDPFGSLEASLQMFDSDFEFSDCD